MADVRHSIASILLRADMDDDWMENGRAGTIGSCVSGTAAFIATAASGSTSSLKRNWMGSDAGGFAASLLSCEIRQMPIGAAIAV